MCRVFGGGGGGLEQKQKLKKNKGKWETIVEAKVLKEQFAAGNRIEYERSRLHGRKPATQRHRPNGRDIGVLRWRQLGY